MSLPKILISVNSSFPVTACGFEGVLERGRREEFVTSQCPYLKSKFLSFHRDSVLLMQISSRLLDLSGVVQASAVMATDSNLALLKTFGLFTEAG